MFNGKYIVLHECSKQVQFLLNEYCASATKSNVNKMGNVNCL